MCPGLICLYIAGFALPAIQSGWLWSGTGFEDRSFSWILLFVWLGPRTFGVVVCSAEWRRMRNHDGGDRRQVAAVAATAAVAAVWRLDGARCAAAVAATVAELVVACVCASPSLAQWTVGLLGSGIVKTNIRRVKHRSFSSPPHRPPRPHWPPRLQWPSRLPSGLPSAESGR